MTYTFRHMRNLKIHIALTLAALLAYPNLCFSQDSAPLEFKGIALGQPIEDFRNNAKFECTTNPKLTHAEERCVIVPGPQPTIAEAPTTASIIYFFGGFVSAINIFFHPRHFEQVKYALEAKYGKPTKQNTEKLIAGSGAAYDNNIIEWNFNKGTIFTQRYSGKVTSTMLEMTAPKHWEKAEDLMKNRALKNAADL